MASFGKYVSNVVKTALSSFSPNKVVAYSQRQYESEYSDCTVLCSHKPHFYFLKVANHFEMTYIPVLSRGQNGDEMAYAFSLFRFQGDEDSGVVAFKRHIEVLEPLTSAHISVNSLCDKTFIERITALCREHCGWSASHIAAALSWVEVFQTAVIRDLVNARDPLSGITPLRLAISGGDLRLLDCLLGIPNLDLTDVDEHGNTVLHLAAKEGSPELLSSLLNRAGSQTDINALNSNGDTALYTACQKPVRDCIELLLNSGANPLIGENELPLQLAVSKGVMDCVELIFERCPESLNFPQPIDHSYPLHLAPDSSIFRRLCEFGANLDSQDLHGISALHVKVRANDLESVMYLLCHGADPNLVDSEGATPLHYAITFGASVHIIRALLIFEVNCLALDNHQQSARHLLCTDSAEYTHSEEKDLALYTLHAVGAQRCPSNMKGCTIGCVAPETAAANNLTLFDGKAPEVTHNPNDDAANLFEEIFSSANLQRYQPLYNHFQQRRFSHSSASVRRTFKTMRTETTALTFRSASPLSDSNVDTLLDIPSSPPRPNYPLRRSCQELSQQSPGPDSISTCRFTLDSDPDENGVQTFETETLLTGHSTTHLARPHRLVARRPLHILPRGCTCDKQFLKDLSEFDQNVPKEKPSVSSCETNTLVPPSDVTDHPPRSFATSEHSYCDDRLFDKIDELSSVNPSRPFIREPSVGTFSNHAWSGSLSRLNGTTIEHNVKRDWNCGPCGYRLLSLDGGGIRGLILVQILRALERTTGKKVTDLFDWMIGTSTGGILSLLILRGKCLRCCRNLLFTFKDTVFYGKRPYPAEGLEKIIRRELGEHTKMTDLKRIRVAITTLVSDRCPPVFHMFRNYTSPRLRLHELLKKRQQSAVVQSHHDRKRYDGVSSRSNPRFKRNSSLSNSSSVFEFLWNASGFRTGGDTSIPASPAENDAEHQFDPVAQDSEQLVWMAARATGAAPTYFRPCGRFLDGGLISNNPTLDLLTELQEMHLVQQMQDKPVSPIAVVVSLGTGRMPVEPIETVDVFRPQSLMETFRSAMGFSSLGRLVVEVATMSEGPVVDRASAWCASLGVPYFRFSPRISLHISLDTTDIKDLLQMAWETEAYLYRARDRIEELASLLI